MKELSLRQDRRPGKNVFYYSKYEEFSIEIMCDVRGKGKWRLCTWMTVNLFSCSKNEIWRRAMRWLEIAHKIQDRKGT